MRNKSKGIQLTRTSRVARGLYFRWPLLSVSTCMCWGSCMCPRYFHHSISVSLCILRCSVAGRNKPWKKASFFTLSVLSSGLLSLVAIQVDHMSHPCLLIQLEKLQFGQAVCLTGGSCMGNSTPNLQRRYVDIRAPVKGSRGLSVQELQCWTPLYNRRSFRPKKNWDPL